MDPINQTEILSLDLATLMDNKIMIRFPKWKDVWSVCSNDASADRYLRPWRSLLPHHAPEVHQSSWQWSWREKNITLKFTEPYAVVCRIVVILIVAVTNVFLADQLQFQLCPQQGKQGPPRCPYKVWYTLGNPGPHLVLL